LEIIAAGGPLFPNVPLDTYGKRASKVTTECSIWLRNVVKITEPNKPFYSHRHTATSYCATPACRMDHPLSKRTSSVTFSAMRARGACWLWQAVVRETEGGVEVIPNPVADSVSEEPIPQ